MHRDLTFNIIFVPDTLPYLGVATQTLLRHSPYRYRLVANGPRNKELELLKAFAQTNPRLEFYAYPTRTPVAHGTLLTLLFHLQDDEYFCFADSDIFARAPFASWLEEELERADAVSSCSALLWEEFPRSLGFSGRCTHTPAGTRNLSSHFAVYRAEPVYRVLEKTGIGFEKRVWPQHFTAYERKILRKEGWLGGMCDTGKLLNFELRRRRHRLVHREHPSLLHLGGISWWLWKEKGANRNMMAEPEVLCDSDLALSPEEQRLVASGRDEIALLQRRRRGGGARWFSAYLYHLFGRAAEPELALNDPELRSRILEACDEIRDAFGSASDFLKSEGAGERFEARLLSPDWKF